MLNPSRFCQINHADESFGRNGLLGVDDDTQVGVGHDKLFEPMAEFRFIQALTRKGGDSVCIQMKDKNRLGSC